MTRKILSWIALALCEAIMITSFIFFGDKLPTEVMILDIVVCSVIIGLFFIDIVRPWEDEHTAKLGTMGVRWTVTIIYTILAVGLMFALQDSEFKIQILVQAGILVLLLLGMAAALRTSDQIVDVRMEEQQKLNNRNNVKMAWTALLEKMDSQPDFPVAVRERANVLLEDMRYLSPSNNPEAIETDSQLVECAAELGRMVTNFNMNAEQAEQIMARCERLMQRRRTQYSN